MPSRILKKVDYVRVNGGFRNASERIVIETTLTINVDGKQYATAMILGTLEKEFVTGNLYVQGAITNARDIKAITIKNNVAEVKLAANVKKRVVPAAVTTDLKVTAEDILTCVKAILKSKVFSETEAVHSAGLFFNGKEAICVAEDLGRHNALDKVIGYGLLHDIDFSQTLAASTGRQPSEMIIKCRNAGIPIIATKGVPTTLAVELAEKAGITIAGLVRGSTMIVYSQWKRVEGCDEI
jgi:FdhD protein